MAEHTQKTVSEKSTERLSVQQKHLIRNELGNVAETAEKESTKGYLDKLQDYVGNIFTGKEEMHQKQIQEWADKYKSVDQKGIEKVVCSKSVKNSFFWRTKTTPGSLKQDPIFEIKEDGLIYFLNGKVEGQKVFTTEEFEDVLRGRRIECCPKIDYEKMKEQSVAIEYHKDCTCVQKVCNSYPKVCSHTPGTPGNQITMTQIPGMDISSVLVQNGLYTGSCKMGCLDGKFALPEKDFLEIILQIQDECEVKRGSTDIRLGRNKYPLLGYDEFCDVECGEECDTLGNHSVRIENGMIVESCEEDGIFMDDIDDETLSGLEEKLHALKTERKLNKKDLSNKERIAFTAALNSGNLSETSISEALIRNGSNSMVVRDVISRIKGVKMRRKAEREMLGMDKKEYRAFRKERRKTIRAEKKEAKAQYKEEFSGKLWRKKKRTERRVEDEIQSVNKREIKQDIKEVKKTRKSLRKGNKKEIRKARRAERKES